MKSVIFFLVFVSLMMFRASAQDIIVRTNGDVLRGTIKGTDFSSVKYVLNDGIPVIATSKEVKQFVWNGEMYVLKTFFTRKKAEDRFVKIIETGKVNLYAIGGQMIAAEPQDPKVKARPSFGIGMGSGGMGGGVGGTITFGGGRRENTQTSGVSGKTFYFIEKPGTGAIQEIALGDVNKTRDLLLLKLGDDTDLADRLKNTDSFDGKILTAFVKAYNAAHP